MALNFFNSFFLVAYLASAMVQFNDPDPLAWVFIYLAAASMCVAHYRKILPRWLPISLLFVSLAWALSLIPALLNGVSWREIFESISMQNKAVEEAREVGGLTLVAIWAAVLAQRPGRSNQ